MKFLCRRILNSPQGTVIVTVDAPMQDGEDWYTTYQIKGKAQRSRKVYGNDAIQSLTLALDVIRKQLEAEFPDAKWDEYNNHGIPLQEPFFIDRNIVRKMEQMIDNELAKPET